jgi:hypothetical protein
MSVTRQKYHYTYLCGKNKYVIGGAEFSLGESISDVLNFDFWVLDKPFQEMELIVSRTPQSNIPNTDLIGMVQTQLFGCGTGECWRRRMCRIIRWRGIWLRERITRSLQILDNR